jgi:acyl-CoA dehydrogenase
MLHYTADLQSKGKPCHMESSMLKVLASEYAVKAADLGIQILGGMGYSAETDMQRYWRDARLWRIGPMLQTAERLWLCMVSCSMPSRRSNRTNRCEPE